MPIAHSVLLDPIRVGAVTLTSRIVMGSMHTGLECHPERFDELGRFYAERARGGAGLIVTGGFAPNFAGRMKNEPGTEGLPMSRPVISKRGAKPRPVAAVGQSASSKLRDIQDAAASAAVGTWYEATAPGLTKTPPCLPRPYEMPVSCSG